MKELFEEYLTWPPGRQLQFLKIEPFLSFTKDDKITFLKELSRQESISSKVLAASIKMLRELRWRDRHFYQQFTEHVDVSVSIAARRGLEACGPRVDTDFFKMREMVKKQNRERKIEAVQQLVGSQEETSEDLLISFLSESDLKVREMAIRELSKREIIDERKLLDLLDRSVWNLKATLIEVLGNRKSELLLEKVEFLVRDTNAEVRLRLVQALAKLNRDHIRKYLIQLTSDSHIYVRREATRLLSSI